MNKKMIYVLMILPFSSLSARGISRTVRYVQSLANASRLVETTSVRVSAQQIVTDKVYNIFLDRALTQWGRHLVKMRVGGDLSEYYAEEAFPYIAQKWIENDSRLQRDYEKLVGTFKKKIAKMCEGKVQLTSEQENEILSLIVPSFVPAMLHMYAEWQKNELTELGLLPKK